MRPSSGTKVILLHENSVLAIQRDDDPNIPYPNKWDFPGGGMEPGESLLACGYREVQEELFLHDIGLTLLDIIQSDHTPGMWKGRAVGRLSTQQVTEIQFGTEGQRFDLFSFAELAQLDFVPELQDYALANQDRIVAEVAHLNPAGNHSTIFEVTRV